MSILNYVAWIVGIVRKKRTRTDLGSSESVIGSVGGVVITRIEQAFGVAYKLTHIEALNTDGIRTGDDADTINFDGEFDRIYCGAPDWLTIEDEAGGRAIGVEKHGLPDAVVWNPHVAKSARMGDFGDDEWKRMVCVEPAAVENAVELKPGAAWTGQQVIKVMPIDAKRTGFP